MRALTKQTKTTAIKLFLTASSYDDIARQLGIGKGSVVTIIDNFREGKLSLPPDMTEYVDQLRRLVVDLKKNHTSIGQLRSFHRIYEKLQELGVGNEQVEDWLEVCQ